MAQQINLHTPLLLQPRKQFSATAMGRALLTLALALAGLGTWMSVQNRGLQREGELAETRQRAERDQLMRGLAAQKQSGDRSTLQQQLHGLELDIAQQRLLLAELDRGRAEPGWAHSDLLALVARTVPPAAWVTELRFSPERMAISGMIAGPAGAARLDHPARKARHCRADHWPSARGRGGPRWQRLARRGPGRRLAPCGAAHRAGLVLPYRGGSLSPCGPHGSCPGAACHRPRGRKTMSISVNTRLARLAQRIDALSLRERVILFASAALLMLALLDQLVLNLD
jgi:hypothetical protein